MQLVLPIAKVLFFLIERLCVENNHPNNLDDPPTNNIESFCSYISNELNSYHKRQAKDKGKLDFKTQLHAKIVRAQKEKIKRSHNTQSISFNSYFFPNIILDERIDIKDEIFQKYLAYLNYNSINDIIREIKGNPNKYIQGSARKIHPYSNLFNEIAELPKDLEEWDFWIFLQSMFLSETEKEKTNTIWNQSKSDPAFYYVYFYNGTGISTARLSITDNVQVEISYFVEEEDYPSTIDTSELLGKLYHDKEKKSVHIALQNHAKAPTFIIINQNNKPFTQLDFISGTYNSHNATGKLFLKKINDSNIPFFEIKKPKEIPSEVSYMLANFNSRIYNFDLLEPNPDYLKHISALFGTYHTIHLDYDKQDILVGTLIIKNDFNVVWSTEFGFSRNFSYYGHFYPSEENPTADIIVRNKQKRRKTHNFTFYLEEQKNSSTIDLITFTGRMAGRRFNLRETEAGPIFLVKTNPDLKKQSIIIKKKRVTSSKALFQEYITAFGLKKLDSLYLKALLVFLDESVYPILEKNIK